MDFLAAAIQSSKAKLKTSTSLTASSSSSSSSSSSIDSNKRKSDASTVGVPVDEPPVKKFKTRGELESERRAAESRERQERLALLRTREIDTQRERDNKLQQEATAQAAKAEAERDAEATMISANEVKRRLRGYSEPITLFGETDFQRFNRLKLFELHQHEKLTSSMGRKNLFAEILQQDVESEIKAAMMKDLEEQRKADDAAANADGTSANGTDSNAPASSSTKNQQSDDDEEVKLDETGKVIQRSHKKKVDYRGKEMKREDFDSAEEFILYFFKRMLSEWEAELDARPKEVRMSERGKMASAVQKQTRAFIKPLFKLLKTRTTSPDILTACEKMATACLQREYGRAQESYLTMAIGNAAWPMGVTMVSIHERAGRTKLNSGHVAHVLNDETQRKYIQSVKRLMTFCEEHYPTGIAPIQ